MCSGNSIEVSEIKKVREQASNLAWRILFCPGMTDVQIAQLELSLPESADYKKRLPAVSSTLVVKTEQELFRQLTRPTGKTLSIGRREEVHQASYFVYPETVVLSQRVVAALAEYGIDSLSFTQPNVIVSQ